MRVDLGTCRLFIRHGTVSDAVTAVMYRDNTRNTRFVRYPEWKKELFTVLVKP